MTNQQLIKQIESKIKEIKSTLTLWIKNIATYQEQLEEMNKQLNTIKKEVKENKKIK